MKKRIVITLLSLFLFSQNVYAAICYCSEYEHINFKLRIANYEGDYGASPAIANDGTIYLNISGKEEGSTGHLIARDPDGNEAILLSDTVSTAGPVLADDGTIYMIITENNQPVLVALSSGGIELWRSQALDSWVFNGPAIAADGSILVTSFLGDLYAFSPQGSLLWQLNYESLAFFPTTIAPNGNIYIPTMGDENSTNRLLVYSSAGEAIWSRTFPVRIFSGLAFNEAGTAYYGADGLYAFTPNGEQLWKGELGEYDVTLITGSPVIDDSGNLYVGYQAANATDEGLPYSGIVSFSSEGTLRWFYSVDNDEVVGATPIITNDGVVIFGSDKGNIFEVNAETGESHESRLATTPVNDIYSLTIDNSGNLIVNGYGGTVIFSDDLELADSSWPKFMRDNRNSSSAATSGGNAPQVYKAANDVDGDGKSDLLWRSYTKGWNFLWTMDGTATATTIPINVVPGTAWDMVGQGDYDADGKSDIFWRNNVTGQNFIYLMEGAVYKSRYTLNYVGATDWRVAGSGDFDGDGTGDVLWRNINRGDTWFYLMDAGLIRDSLPSLAVNDLNYEIAATGDVDGDGDDDVIWRNSASGINYIWLMQGGSIASRYTLNTVNTEWDIAGAGDLDGDGTDDIILRNQVSGENWVYFMENGQIRESTLINTVADTNWQIANMGDYDGDGKSDFLWRHAADARNIIHLMDGTTRKASGVLKNTDDTWRVVN